MFHMPFSARLGLYQLDGLFNRNARIVLVRPHWLIFLSVVLWWFCFSFAYLLWIFYYCLILALPWGVVSFFFFFFKVMVTPGIYTLSLSAVFPFFVWTLFVGYTVILYPVLFLGSLRRSSST